MKVTRRQFGKSVMAGALMLGRAGWLTAAVAEQSVTVLLGCNPHSRVFGDTTWRLLGGRAHDMIPECDLTKVVQLREYLHRDVRDGVIVGMVGTDFFPVLEILFRHVGGRMLLHAVHVSQVGGATRHVFYTAGEESVGVVRSCVSSLPTSHLIREVRLDQPSLDAGFHAGAGVGGGDWLQTMAEMYLHSCRAVAGKSEPYSVFTAPDLPQYYSVESFVYRL